MVTKKKTATEKLNESHGLPKVVKLTDKQAAKWGKGTIAIPAPRDVDAIMKKVPEGKLTTINQIRKIVAEKNHATIGCPITCGIFSCIAARAAEEQRAKGVKNTTPWWRTLRGEGELSEKYPGDIILQKGILEKEGHKIIKKGKKYFVENYEKALVKV